MDADGNREARGCVVNQESEGTTLFHCGSTQVNGNVVTFNLENFGNAGSDANVDVGIGSDITSLAIVLSCPETEMPSAMPSGVPSGVPSAMPSGIPETEMPSAMPSGVPSGIPETEMPSAMPSGMPETESGMPSAMPSAMPSGIPDTEMPSAMPSGMPSAMPSAQECGVWLEILAFIVEIFTFGFINLC